MNRDLRPALRVLIPQSLIITLLVIFMVITLARTAAVEVGVVAVEAEAGVELAVLVMGEGRLPMATVEVVPHLQLAAAEVAVAEAEEGLDLGGVLLEITPQIGPLDP